MVEARPVEPALAVWEDEGGHALPDPGVPKAEPR